MAGNLEADFALHSEIFGDYFRNPGELAEALKSYQDGLSARKKHAEMERTNVIAQRDLARSYDRIGDVLADMKNLAGAYRQFHAGLAIRERIAAGDPSNGLWQMDLIESHWRLAQNGNK